MENHRETEIWRATLHKRFNSREEFKKYLDVCVQEWTSEGADAATVEAMALWKTAIATAILFSERLDETNKLLFSDDLREAIQKYVETCRSLCQGSAAGLRDVRLIERALRV